MARVGQIRRVHELVPVVARAQDVDRRPLRHELEEHGDDPQATVAEDGTRTHDRHVEPRRHRVAAQHLGLQLRPPVRLERPSGRRLRHRVRVGNAEHRARRRVDDLADSSVTRREQDIRRADHVDRVKELAIAREGHLGHVVQHHIDAVARDAERLAVANVALHEVDLLPGCRRGRGFVEVEHPDAVAAGSGLFDDDRAEVAAPAGDEDRASAHKGSPRSRQKRTLARMPSSSSVGGS